MPRLPSPHPGFTAKKTKILQALTVPLEDYSDASPKGSVDAGIRDLIDEINTQDGLVTTSSCAGRVSVFAEGRKSSTEEGGARASAVGGKGGGGAWLFVSHDPVEEEGMEGDGVVLERLGLGGGGGGKREDGDGDGDEGGDERWIHFKFEPMILHILTTSSPHAQLILKCGLQAGFRESGAVTLLPPTTKAGVELEPASPMVAIRSMGLSFESLIGKVDGSGKIQPIVSVDYLRLLVKIGNERFVENEKRIARFLEALRAEVKGLKEAESADGNGNGKGKSEKELRRQRKMAEGLRRQAEMAEAKRSREAEAVEDLAGRIEDDGELI